jgi:histidinol-phosphatase
MHNLTSDLALALKVADAADAVSLAGFNTRSFTVERKADKSEVTEIDRATETAITNILRAERPEHSVFGEEHGIVGPSDTKFQWVIDPIDGTSNFVRGVPVWASLIALVENNVPVLGVVSAPALQMRWWAHLGGGAFYNSKPIRVSNIETLAQASLSITATRSWDKTGATAALTKLQNDVSRVRGYGDFWQHMLVAQGVVDIAIDNIGLAPYDIAALVPIVQEAGGKFSDRFGTNDWRANSLITSNKLLHDATLAYLPK